MPAFFISLFCNYDNFLLVCLFDSSNIFSTIRNVFSQFTWLLLYSSFKFFNDCHSLVVLLTQCFQELETHVLSEGGILGWLPVAEPLGYLVSLSQGAGRNYCSEVEGRSPEAISAIFY